MKKYIYGILTPLLFAVGIYACSKASTNGVNSQYKQPITDTTPSPPKGTGFVHPGVLNTKESLDLIARQAEAGDPVRLAAYRKVTDFISARTYPSSFPKVVYVGSNGHTSPSKSQIRSDAELAYAYALRFAKTADIQDAKKCIGILNGWAYNFEKYDVIDHTDNPNQPALETSWTTPSFVAAAEIIRYYKPQGVSAGWDEKDIRQFSDYLNNVKNNYINKIPNYKNNWNVSAGYAKVAIGVFLNSQAVYDDGKRILNTVLPQVIDKDGIMPELCVRQDCVHYQYSLTGLVYAAEIAAIRGDSSLYEALSQRIAAGYSFMHDAYNSQAGCNVCREKSPMFPGIEVALKHYGAADMQSLRDQQAPFGVPRDHTFLGFTSYTHYKTK